MRGLLSVDVPASCLNGRMIRRSVTFAVWRSRLYIVRRIGGENGDNVRYAYQVVNTVPVLRCIIRDRVGRCAPVAYCMSTYI